MPHQWKREKPNAVRYAEYALWAWTAWMCLFGIYQSWAGIPDIEKMVADQAQGLFEISPATLLEIIIAGYAVLAATLGWVVFRIGAGKRWARTSLLVGFALDILSAVWPPYHGVVSYLTDVPNIGLQSYALYLLYTWPGERWFVHEKHDLPVHD